MRNPKAKVSNPIDFVTCPGSAKVPVYEPKVLSDGSIDVVVAGYENQQDKIESFRPQTDMSFILKQMALGNNEVLVKSVGQYGDFTQMPKTMAEAMQLQIDAEREFYKLDVDTRSKFNHDFRKWLVSAGSPEWIENMGLAPEKSVPSDEAVLAPDKAE